MKTTARVLITVVVFGTFCAAAHAVPMLKLLSSTKEADHYWWYEYYVDFTNYNPGDPSVFDVFIDHIYGAEVSQSPEGWDHIQFVSFNHLGGWVQWTSTAPQYDVAPGQTLAGFKIRSPLPPSTDSADYVLTDDNGGEHTGKVTGPVPEPGSLALLALGLVALGLLRARRRR